jgi:predicted metal-dependent phosphoesterase TrpH
VSDGTRVDLHVKVLDEAVVDRAKARGIDVLVYAPHFTRWPEIAGQAAEYSDDDLLVVPGRELFTGDWRHRRHVLALDLAAPIPDFISLEATMAALDRQDAVTLVPHPTFLTVSLGREDIVRYLDQIDALEVYNPKHWPRHNERAEALAAEFDLPAFSSSYAHLRGTVGEAWTEFDRDIDSAGMLHDALREGASRRVLHEDGWEHRARRGLEFAHLGWENTYEKVDRVLLSGMEPTHPSHVAYGGEFDDATVY